MPPGKLPAGPRSDSNAYQSIPLVLIARLLRMVSRLVGAGGAWSGASRGGPIGLLRKQRADDAASRRLRRRLGLFMSEAAWSGRRGSNPRPSAWEARYESSARGLEGTLTIKYW